MTPLSVEQVAYVLEAAGPISTARLEAGAMFAAMNKTGGNVFQASRILGLAKSTMHRKLRQYHIRWSVERGAYVDREGLAAAMLSKRRGDRARLAVLA